MMDVKIARDRWKRHKAVGRANTKAFAIGDIPGQADLLAKTLEAIRLVPRSADLPGRDRGAHDDGCAREGQGPARIGPPSRSHRTGPATRLPAAVPAIPEPLRHSA